jgi:tryptophanyl-tRNA synthetase
MAADILIYQTNLVPVGKDQIQHVEVARDIAGKFNEKYGNCFILPEPFIQEQVAVVPGTDGQKMSKSHGNTIEVFGEESVVRKKIMSIVMDSRPLNEAKPDADKNLAIQLLKLVAPESVAVETETLLREGKLGYGSLKSKLFDCYSEYFAAPRKLYLELKNNQSYVESILKQGRDEALKISNVTLENVRRNAGL